MSDNKLKKIMPILCILWICLIFFMSSDARSYYKTLTFSETVVSQINGTEAGIEINGNTDENWSDPQKVDSLIFADFMGYKGWNG